MTKKQIWQYKCDFCGKKRLSAGAMAKHEKHCTMNPDRICRLHSHGSLDEQVPMSVLLEALKTCKTEIQKQFIGMDNHVEQFQEVRVPVDLKPLRDAAGECPMCIFAAIRQSGHHPKDCKFDYENELKEFWRQENEDIRASGDY